MTTKTKKIIGYSFLTLFLIGLAWCLAFGITTFGKIFVSNKSSDESPILKVFSMPSSTASLKGEGEGRINFLLLGIPGGNYPGPKLTDTIIVVSIDTKSNTLAFLSVPRDLWVKPAGYNYYTKINSIYTLGEQNKKRGFLSFSSGSDGLSLMKETVSEILGIPIHYGAVIDFEGFKKIIDTLGGIDIYVEKSIYDPYFPNGYGGYTVFSIQKGYQHLDGETALRYARSRKTTSDFDRAKRQQQVMLAVKKKIEGLGFWDFGKIYQIITIVGNHFKTDVSPNEIKALISIVKKIDFSKTIQVVLDSSSTGPLRATHINGAYVLIPKKGMGNYEDLQRIAKNIFIDPFLKKESAKIAVRNGTNTAGVARSCLLYTSPSPRD